MAKMKMIIDCDTGVDDALAITYILANPDIDLLGVTTTFGNVSVELATKNSLLITELFGREDVRICSGASHSWLSDCFVPGEVVNVHGRNGIGDVDLGEPKRKPDDSSAVSFILDSARKYGEALHLVFVGPLVNLAECIREDEEALRGVGRITIMGGALTIQGNRNIYSEANIAEDPSAAKYVFGSSLHLDIVPLDATLRTMFRVSDIKEWKDINHKGASIYNIARYYYMYEYNDENIGGAMHDPLAAFASYDPSIITDWFACNLTVEETGRTIASFEELNLPVKRHRVALDVDTERFTREYIRLVSDLIRS